MKLKKRYMNMTEVGKIFGVTSHVVGKWLKQMGLRRHNGTPSSDAYEHGLIDSDFNEYGTYNVLWDAARVIAILDEAGHKRANPPPADLVEAPFLRGPFEAEEGGDGVWVIAGADEQKLISASGDTNAKVLTHILNLAHEGGYLKSVLDRSE